MHTLLYKDPGTDLLRVTQCTARLLYQLCGMPFIDLAHVCNSDVIDGVLVYRRIKTGVKVCVKILQPVVDTMRTLQRLFLDQKKKSGVYALGILSGKYMLKSLPGYSEYQSALRGFNSRLSLLAARLGINGRISTYSLRHSWATTAKNTGASIEMISELLGHKSIRTTQIYLSSFNVVDLARVNRRACSYAENVN